MSATKTKLVGVDMRVGAGVGVGVGKSGAGAGAGMGAGGGSEGGGARVLIERVRGWVDTDGGRSSGQEGEAWRFWVGLGVFNIEGKLWAAEKTRFSIGVFQRSELP